MLCLLSSLHLLSVTVEYVQSECFSVIQWQTIYQLLQSSFCNYCDIFPSEINGLICKYMGSNLPDGKSGKL